MMKLAIVLLLVFGLGGCLGSKMNSPDVEFVTITKTKTVTEPAPPAVEVEVVPESCITALRYAAQIADASSNIYNRGDEQLTIISEARSALAIGIEMSKAEARQRDLLGLLVGDLAKLSDATSRYETALKSCESE